MFRLTKCVIKNFFTTTCVVLMPWILQSQIQHINFRHYSLPDGLSSYKVVKVLQDRFGFIWLATQDGLNRFDGKDITIYNKSAREKHLLVGSDITDMVEDTSRNILWVITSYGGLNGIDLQTGSVKVAVADSSNKFSDPWLRTLIQSGDELWIGTYNNITLYNIRENKIKKLLSVPVNESISPKAEYDINLFYKDEHDRIWSFSNYGITIYSTADHSILYSRPISDLGLPEEYVFRRMNSCIKLSPGQILLASHKGIKRIIYDKAAIRNISEENITVAGDKEIRCMTFDKAGNLWFAIEGGLYKKNNQDGRVNIVEDVNQTDRKKWTHSVNMIYFDGLENLWLGTLQGFALATRTHSPFLNFFQSADLKTKIDRVIYIFPYNDSTEYVCAYDGFYMVDNRVKNIERIKLGTFWYMFRHADGKLIVGGENKPYVFNLPGHFTDIEKIYPELNPIRDESINSAVYWNDSLVFFGSEKGNGVYVWNYKEKTLAKLNNKSSLPLKSGIINNIYKDKLNRIWILSDNSFAIYTPANHQLENYELINPETALPLTFFFDICEASGYYWLASYGSGIIQLDDQFRIKNIISTGKGMVNAGLYNVFPVDDSLLFATSNNGLSRININDFKVTNYFESDGLHSNAFEESCGIVYNGKIYAGGPDGFTIVDPKFISGNTNPPVLHISNIVIEKKTGRQEFTDIFLRSLSLPGNLLQATIYFSGINYFNPELTTYSYRIKGQQDEWINLGTQNFVNLIGLSPATYTLQVQAYNEDGVASKIKEIELIFLPKWYQTAWFKVGVVLLALAIIYGLYKMRINQLKKEEEIRTNLAGDLHDDLGSTLNSVKIYANMALMEKDNHTYLEKIKESTNEAIAGVRDIIWVLDDKKDLLDHLLSRIQSFALPLCEAHRISFQREVSDPLLNYKLGKEEKRNLYMIMKEAVNNSIKYANASSISLIIDKKGNNMSIRISDNGAGFDQNKITEGNGLKNIIRRAAEIGYRAEIISSIGTGTTVLLEKN